jgi:hypothetical protein
LWGFYLNAVTPDFVPGLFVVIPARRPEWRVRRAFS